MLWGIVTFIILKVNFFGLMCCHIFANIYEMMFTLASQVKKNVRAFHGSERQETTMKFRKSVRELFFCNCLHFSDFLIERTLKYIVYIFPNKKPKTEYEIFLVIFSSTKLFKKECS